MTDADPTADPLQPIELYELAGMLPQLIELAPRLRASSSATPMRTTVVVEDLIPREHTILELLPSHLSYSQIATRLYLSVNTVKMNLKSIYGKLGVSSRSEAVDAARRAGLL